MILIILIGISIVCSFRYETIDEISVLGRNWIIGTLRIASTTFYDLFGYLMKDQINRMIQFRKKWIAIVIMVAIQVVLCWWWDDSNDVQVFRLGNPWLYFIKGVNRLLLIVFIAQAIHSDVLKKLGQKTKELMILHYAPFYYALILRYLLGKLFAPNVLGMIIIWVVTTVYCLSIDWILSRFKAYKFIMGR